MQNQVTASYYKNVSTKFSLKFNKCIEDLKVFDAIL